MSAKEQELLMKKELGYDSFDSDLTKNVMDFAELYKDFMVNTFTERTFVAKSVQLLEENGYKKYERGMSLNSGDKIYFPNRGRALIAVEIGTESLGSGVNLVGSHVDSPKLDLKPVPLMEADGCMLIKTHYYGGIKKYNWTAIPLALIGTVALKTGETVDVSIGLDEQDTVFTISDLLPHLASKQMQKKMSEGITGEQLNAVGATIPFDDEDAKEKIKLNFIYLLNEKYNITEADLISADLCLVPAFKLKDVGLDRSLLGGYGQDDRVCAYTSLKALLDSKPSDKTKVVLFSDREEVGSMGNTGMESKFLENTLEELADCFGVKLRDILTNTVCLSSDVCAAYDPNYAEVFEKNNTPFLNGGVAFMKYTGARGKSGSSEASAELVSKIRAMLDDNDVKWQIGELGKVDEGGGGTIAQMVANLGADVIDCGVPLWSMHSPFEISSKYDVYMAYKAYKVFFGA
ncbi:MAG: aminopeptidase [Clostridia bacterium]|nr:aminopeptidase [Clostridia bacterium]